MRIPNRHIIILLSGALMITSCIEEYTPDIATYENAIAVDAVFTNSDEPSKVTLTQVVGYNDYDIDYLEGAQVRIEEEGGASHQLREEEPGRFLTDPLIFKGQPGKRYRLSILLEENQEILSDWEEMMQPASILNINKVFEERVSLDPNQEDDKGFSLHADADINESNTAYYRWSYLETYEFRVPYPTRVDFTGNQEVVPHDRLVETCWRHIASQRSILTTSVGLETSKIEDIPIQFVSILTDKIYIKYAILIRLHALNKKAYQYHLNISQQTETSGSLFDPIPTENFGNLQFTNSDLPVLGFFEVSGIDEKRVWVDRDELPFNPVIPTGFESCPEITINSTNPGFYNRVIARYLEQGYVLVDSLFPFITWQGWLLTTPQCADCTETGTNIKPAFWE